MAIAEPEIPANLHGLKYASNGRPRDDTHTQGEDAEGGDNEDHDTVQHRVPHEKREPRHDIRWIHLQADQVGGAEGDAEQANRKGKKI